MGYIVNAKLLKYRNTYLFQRRCNTCKEKYLFHYAETKTQKVFVCEYCDPIDVFGVEQTPGVFGAVKIDSWENRVVEIDRDYRVRRVSTRNFKKVLERDKFICQYCYHDGDCIDHIKPVVLGGGNQEWNLVCACRRCNSTAGALLFQDWAAKRDYIISKIKRKRA